ncbi:MAG: PAS domain-containing protein [Cyclobacteriaceae bacterium]
MKKLDSNETAFSARDQDKRLRMALSGAKMSLWEINLTNEMVKWSGPSTGHFSKFSKSIKESLNAYFKLIHPSDLGEVIRLIENAKTDQNFFNQHRVLWPDNTYHWMEGSGIVFEENGDFKMTGTVQDITERKKLETEREDWKVRHELVARAAGIIVYDYNILSGDILWSGNIQEVLGFTSKQMGNIDRWVELIHPEDREDAFEKLESAQKNLETYEVYYRFLKSNSKYCDVYDRGTFLERDGQAYRMLGMMSDVTEWRKSREALSESENRFRSLINNLNVGVGLYDVSMVPVVHNEAAFKLLGMTEKQFIGKVAVDPDWNVIDMDGNKMLPRDFPIPQAIETKIPCRQVVMGVYRPKSKDRVWLMVDADPLLDENGDIRHVICTYSDFSARKRVEEILAEKNEQLVITSDLVSRKNERLLEFAQIVSHNLRSPLSNISGLVDIYKTGSQEEKDDAVAYISEVTEKALSTIDDLNEVLKVQQSEHMDLQVIKFENALEEVKELLGSNLKERNAVISTDFGEADEVFYPNIYMESIFLNLLSNSLKYIDPGKAPKILIKSKRIDRDIHFEFKDNGFGIDLKKNGDDVFKFGKTFHSTKGSKGLGLYLIKNQIRTMGDEIEVESQPNKGTMIRIKFKNQDGRK